MTHESNAYPRLGFWDRQKELIEEARRLHQAAKAVREARRTAKATRANGALGTQAATTGRATVGDAATPPRVGSRRAASSPRRPLPVWRSAAARMGSSLVAVGERLERLAQRQSERP